MLGPLVFSGSSSLPRSKLKKRSSSRQSRSSSWESRSSLFTRTEACLDDFRTFLFDKKTDGNDTDSRARDVRSVPPKSSALDVSDLDFDLNGLAAELDGVLASVGVAGESRRESDEMGNDDDGVFGSSFEPVDLDDSKDFEAAANSCSSALPSMSSASTLKQDNLRLQERIEVLEKLIAERDEEIEAAVAQLRRLKEDGGSTVEHEATGELFDYAT